MLNVRCSHFLFLSPVPCPLSPVPCPLSPVPCPPPQSFFLFLKKNLAVPPILRFSPHETNESELVLCPLNASTQGLFGEIHTPKKQSTHLDPLIQPQSPTHTVMKPTLHLLILAAASSGIAFGQTVTAYTPPVGYETLAVSPGVNFLGLRLQRPAVVSGKLTAVTSSSVSDSAVVFEGTGAVLSATKTYILEVENANGVTQEFLGSAASGSTITTPDLSAKVAVNDLYTIRESPTLASTFGLNNSVGLESSFGGFGGDIIMLPNPAAEGSFDQYYYDDGLGSWADVNGNAVDAEAIAWNYADGVVIVATGGGITELTVSGTVKTGKTNYSLQSGANAVNFLSSVSPAQATLSSAFGATNQAGLATSFGGFGGDIVMIPNPVVDGGFDQYYYDDGLGSWADVNGSAVMGTDVSLTSGIIIINSGDIKDVVSTPPTAYDAL